MLDLIIALAALIILFALLNWLIKIDDEEVCESCSNYQKRKDMEVVGGDIFYLTYACKSCMSKLKKK